MTILLSLSQSSNLDTLCRAVYAALIAADCPDLASDAVVVRGQARDADEYAKLVLGLSDDLRFDWREA